MNKYCPNCGKSTNKNGICCDWNCGVYEENNALSDRGGEMKAKKEAIEQMARVGYEKMKKSCGFNEQWDDLHEKNLWREIASDMFNVLVLMAKEWKGVKEKA